MLQVQAFGSFASGLGMHGSDLDLVITGLVAPDDPHNGGECEVRGLQSVHRHPPPVSSGQLHSDLKLLVVGLVAPANPQNGGWHDIRRHNS